MKRRLTALFMSLFMILPLLSFPATSVETDEGATGLNDYFYGQLDATGRIFYDALVDLYNDSTNGLTTGVGERDLTEEIGQEALKAYAGGNTALAVAFQAGRDAFAQDYTMLFYLDFSKLTLRIGQTEQGFVALLGRGGNENYYKAGYTSKEQIEKAIATLETSTYVKTIFDAVAESRNLITDDNEYIVTAVRTVHNELIKRSTYTYPSATNNTVHGIPGLLLDGKANCEGYARSFKWFMDELGIPCLLINGVGKNSRGVNEEHMWNYVQVDGRWYAVDATWDDPINSDSVRDTYLLRGQTLLAPSHYAFGELSYGGVTFEYPELSDIDYEDYLGESKEDETQDIGKDLKVETIAMTDDEGDAYTLFRISYKGYNIADALKKFHLYTAVRIYLPKDSPAVPKGNADTTLAPSDLINNKVEGEEVEDNTNPPADKVESEEVADNTNLPADKVEGEEIEDNTNPPADKVEGEEIEDNTNPPADKVEGEEIKDNTNPTADQVEGEEIEDNTNPPADKVEGEEIEDNTNPPADKVEGEEVADNINPPANEVENRTALNTTITDEDEEYIPGGWFSLNDDMELNHGENYSEFFTYQKSYVEFCMTTMAMDTDGFYSVDLALQEPEITPAISKKLNIISFTQRIIPSFVLTSNPPLTQRIDPVETVYTMEFDKPLVLDDESKDPTITVTSTQTGIESKAEYISHEPGKPFETIDGVTVYPTVVKFKFTPDTTFQGYVNIYTLQVENLVTKTTVKDKNDVETVVVKKPNSFGIVTSYPMSIPCPMYSANGGVSNAFVMGYPTLVGTDGDIFEYTDEENLPAEKPSALDIRLVATIPNEETTDDMLDALPQGVNPKASAAYDLSLTCQNYMARLKQGNYQLSIGLPYPEGFHPEDNKDVQFKAYHYIKNKDGSYTVEELVCQITPQGLVVIANDFSPFMIVATDKPATPEPVKVKTVNVATRTAGGKVTYQHSEAGTLPAAGLYAVESGKSQSFTITPDSGYEVERILIDGKEVRTRSANQQTFSFANMSEQASLEVFFIANTVKEKEEQSNIVPVAPPALPAIPTPPTPPTPPTSGGDDDDDGTSDWPFSSTTIAGQTKATSSVPPVVQPIVPQPSAPAVVAPSSTPAQPAPPASQPEESAPPASSSEAESSSAPVVSEPVAPAEPTAPAEPSAPASTRSTNLPLIMGVTAAIAIAGGLVLFKLGFFTPKK